MTVRDPVEELEVRELFARATVDERQGFRSDLRSRLLAQVGPVAQTRRSTPWWSLRVPRFAVAGVAVVAMLFGGTGLAAAGSLPGEPLFDVKRAAEEVALALAFDDDTRVERLSDQASARLAELARATDARTRAAAAAESARAVERLAGEVERDESGATGEAAAEAARILGSAAEILRAIEPTLPAEAQEGIRRAIEATGGSERGPRTDPTPPPGRAPGVAPATPDARPSTQPTPRGPEATPARSEPGRPANVPTGPPAGRPSSAPPTPPAETPEALRPPPAVPTPPATGR